MTDLISNLTNKKQFLSELLCLFIKILNLSHRHKFFGPCWMNSFKSLGKIQTTDVTFEASNKVIATKKVISLLQILLHLLDEWLPYYQNPL